jgi:hypothetical protein
MHKLIASIAAAVAFVACALPASADEAAIRKTIAERMPTFPKIDEIQKTAIPGIYEVRVGVEIVYADENGNHLFMGNPNGNVNLVSPSSRRSTSRSCRSRTPSSGSRAPGRASSWCSRIRTASTASASSATCSR